MSRSRTQFVLPFLIVAVGIAAAALLAMSKESPERRVTPELAPLVEVEVVHPEAVAISVRGHGTVRARHVVDIVPQVGGKIVEVHPALVGGGSFRQGALLVAIDPRDYELAVRRLDAELARAEVRLETEQAEAAIARDEWDRLHPGEEPPTSLVLREPQVRQAEAELDAARASVDRARLDLSRTRIVAPFDGRVISEKVEKGQFVVAGQSMATIHDAGHLEVPVPLQDDELAWFGVGASAEVRISYAGALHRWPARIGRIEGVDAASRMVTVVAEIEPEEAAAAGLPALLPGMFAEVEIAAGSIDGFPVPRAALRSDGRIWVVGQDGRLQITEVTVARSDRETAIVTSGLTAGDLVILTNLEAVTDGMAVRTESKTGEGAES